MKRYTLLPLLSLLLLAAGTLFPLKAQETTPEDSLGIEPLDFRVSRSDGHLTVEMELLLAGLRVESNRAVLLTPSVTDGERRRDFAPVGIYGRLRYYHYLRNGLLGGTDETLLRASRKPDTLAYRASLPYEEWMDGAQILLHREDYGCCQELMDERKSPLGIYRMPVYTPLFVYARPQADSVKTRSLAGAAYVEFLVNKTDIRPDYRNNRAELDKIKATIDSVRNDADTRITALSIKGFASPEGRYDNNVRLARERTEALREYVARLYDFPESFITVAYEPEDWEGLRAYVERSSLAHREAILAMIDSEGDPDAKERGIRSAYPEDYRQIREHCYPALRHSDYRVEYVIRSFKDPEEIRRVLRVSPQKLNLQEFYLAANGLEPGSEAFREIYETAVRMYPDDEAANLNAANAAMYRGLLDVARRYLDKAGTSPLAVYARGVCAALSKDYDEAQLLFGEARAAGVGEAEEALRQVDEIKKHR